MALPFVTKLGPRIRRVCRLMIAFLILCAVPGSARCQAIINPKQTLNEKVVKYLSSNVGTRLGGGQAIDAVTEALRVSGGAFTEHDLGSDYPGEGDRMWGKPIKVVSSVNGKFADSSPSATVMPGDILHYKETTFVYLTENGRKSTTTTVTAPRHTSVIAKVDKKGTAPLMVYEQNAAAAPNVDTRKLTTSSIDFGALRDGSIVVYRPKARVDQLGKYQVSVVNNTKSTKAPVIKTGLKTVTNFSLNPSNTASSYTALWVISSSPDQRFTLVLPNGASMVIENAAAYEIYNKTSGIVSVRMLSP